MRKYLLLLFLVSICLFGCSQITKEQMVIQLAEEKFYQVRKGYKKDLLMVLDKINPDLKNNKIQDDINEMLDCIPQSPGEFFIYDSIFYTPKRKSIEIFERMYVKTTIQENDSTICLKLIREYVNMYSFMYSGIVRDETRLEDGYYFYDINKMAVKKPKLFCGVIKDIAPNRLKINDELITLYNCRCLQKNLDEFSFCN